MKHLFLLILLSGCAGLSSLTENRMGYLAAHEALERHQFPIHRGLEDYKKLLGSEFKKNVDTLKSPMLWMDAGAGEGFAQKDFLGSRDGSVVMNPCPQMVAVTYKYENKTKYRGNSCFRLMVGKKFEEYKWSNHRKVDLLTDVMGVLSYTTDPAFVLNNYLELLRSTGEIYVFMPMEITKVKRGETYFYFVDWLKTIDGLEVTKLVSDPDGKEGNAFRIRIVKPNTRVPSLFLEESYQQKYLYRMFEERGP